MESEKSEHVIRSAVAGATRMPSDGTDDDEVRERGVVPEVCFHCGRPNPVLVFLDLTALHLAPNLFPF